MHHRAAEYPLALCRGEGSVDGTVRIEVVRSVDGELPRAHQSGVAQAPYERGRAVRGETPGRVHGPVEQVITSFQHAYRCVLRHGRVDVALRDLSIVADRPRKRPTAGELPVTGQAVVVEDGLSVVSGEVTHSYYALRDHRTLSGEGDLADSSEGQVVALHDTAR